jgi:carbamoyl-phosphate synthase large subunit
VPTVAEELVTLAEASETLAQAGLAHWLPTPTAVRACTDKWRFAHVLVEHGIAGPTTQLGSVEGVPGPWIVKPRFGRGSRDVIAVDDADELGWALAKVPDPIVQTRLSGREFTVDALVDRGGALAGAVPRWRLETKAGISTKGRTFEDKSLVREVGRVLSAVGLEGPANVQGFVDDAGEVSFMEVNPRFSGGLPLSLAAGADLVGEYVRGILGQPVRSERLAFKPGVTMLRHFAEVFE